MDWKHAKAVLFALVSAWQKAPGRPLTSDVVLREGWPGERMQRKAGLSRVYVTLARLRDLGLRELILNARGGYLLDPLQIIMVSASSEAGTWLYDRSPRAPCPMPSVSAGSIQSG